MKLGLLFGKDVEITTQGQPDVVMFQHKLLHEWTAAVYLSEQVKQNPNCLKSEFPTWEVIEKHKEFIMFICGLQENVDISKHVVNHAGMILERMIRNKLNRDECLSTLGEIKGLSLLSSFQKEGPVMTPKFCIFPSSHQSHSLSEALHQSEFVVVQDLIGEDCGATLSCNADIVLNIDDAERNEGKMEGALKTLNRCSERIISVHLLFCKSKTVDNIASLLPAKSLVQLCIVMCDASGTVVPALAEMPQLRYLMLLLNSENFTAYGDSLVAAVNAWKGKSMMRVFNLFGTMLPTSVCQPLLAAIAANCPCLRQLNLYENTLSGCLEAFLKDPPSRLKCLEIASTSLQEEDRESLTTAVSAGKLKELEELNIGYNTLGGCLAGLLQDPPPRLRRLGMKDTSLQAEDIESLTTAVTTSKLQELEELDISNNNLAEAVVEPLLQALLETRSHRKLTLRILDQGAIALSINIISDRFKADWEAQMSETQIKLH